jgi:hypothetical protein
MTTYLYGGKLIRVLMRRIKIFKSLSLIIGGLMLSALYVPQGISQNPVDNIQGTPAGWSDDINLSRSSLEDRWPSIAINNDTVHIIWRSNVTDILYRNSINGGATWSSTNTLFQSIAASYYPDIAVSGLHVHTVWSNYESTWPEISYCNSTNGGFTWNPISRLVTPTGYDVAGPRIYVNNSNIHIIWGDFRDGADGEIYYRRSLDGGTTFDDGQGVNQDRRITSSPAPTGNGRLAGSGSNISVLWSDERNGNWDIYWMISKDNGYTWEDGLGNLNVGRRISNDASDSFAAGVAVDGSNIHIIWVDELWPGPEYRIYYRSSIDNGITWNPITLLTGPSPLMASPDIAVKGNKIQVAWDDARDDGSTMDIYYKNSTGGGTSWDPDMRLTYSEGFHSYHPRLDLNNATVHIVWWDLRDGNREIYYKRSPDFPDISPPTHSNEMPPPDSYKDPPGTNISVRVTDPSGVNASSIKLYVNGSLVSSSLTPIADGYNISYASPGLHSGEIVCRIVANDTLNNHLDYNWSFTVLDSYKIPVFVGWNLISTPLVIPNSNLPGALLDRDGDTLWDRAMSYNASDTTDHWKQFNGNWPASMNDLNNLNNRMGWWLNVTNVGDGFLNVTGLLPTTTQISLRAGWNLVGYPTLSTSMTVGNAFWGTGADIVEVFDQSAIYRTKVVGPSYVMKPGEAYWVHCAADSIWTINW